MNNEQRLASIVRRLCRYEAPIVAFLAWGVPDCRLEDAQRDFADARAILEELGETESHAAVAELLKGVLHG